MYLKIFLIVIISFIFSAQILAQPSPSEFEIKQDFINLMSKLESSLLVKKDNDGQIIYEGELISFLNAARTGKSPLNEHIAKIYPLLKGLEESIEKFFEEDTFNPYEFYLEKIAAMERVKELRMAVRVVNISILRYNQRILNAQSKEAEGELRKVIMYVEKIEELWTYHFAELYKKLSEE